MAICMSCSWNSGTPRVLLQRRLQQRVQVGDGLLAVAAADVGVDRPALDGPGADEGHLDHQVVEARGACSRGRVAIWARVSTWNTPTESARHNMS